MFVGVMVNFTAFSYLMVASKVLFKREKFIATKKNEMSFKEDL